MAHHKRTWLEQRTLVEVSQSYEDVETFIISLRSENNTEHANWQLRPHLYGLIPETTLPRVTLAEATSSLFLCKIQPTVYMIIANPSRSGGGERMGAGWEQANTGGQVNPPRWGSVTLASAATFLEIDALVRPTRTSRRVASVLKCLQLGF